MFGCVVKFFSNIDKIEATFQTFCVFLGYINMIGWLVRHGGIGHQAGLPSMLRKAQAIGANAVLPRAKLLGLQGSRVNFVADKPQVFFQIFLNLRILCRYLRNNSQNHPKISNVCGILRGQDEYQIT